MREYSLLLVNNNRSKAYVQTFLQAGLLPSAAVVMDTGGSVLAEHTDNDRQLETTTNQRLIRRCSVTGLEFDEKERVETTLERAGIPTTIISADDPNDPDVIKAVGKLPTEEVVYSGPGGAILREELFNTGKRFIHAHPGRLPDFRGSTTVYYSLLLEGALNVSVIYLSEKIDRGDLLLQKEYKYVQGSDLDYIIDPCIRAAAITDFLKTRPDARRQPEDGNTFYVIHPVIKHLAILKADSGLNRKVS